MFVTRLVIKDWKQFENIDISFTQRVNILVGANGSGKTTILNLLARQFGWSIPELSLPESNEKGQYEYTGHRSGQKNAGGLVGTIYHSDNSTTKLTIPTSLESVVYTIGMQSSTIIPGIMLPSHRHIFHYSKIRSIATRGRSIQEAYRITAKSYQTLYSGEHTHGSNYYIKETLLGWAVAGGGNEFIQQDGQAKGYFLDFQSILRKVLPKEIGFKKISIRDYEVVLETVSGCFLIDAVSGGISSIIDLTWQIFSFSLSQQGQFVVLIDEIENHLHPSMQRELLFALSNAFPKAQFIVTTHSPLVVTSVRTASVYALVFNSGSRVSATKLGFSDEKVLTANEVLNDILGLPTSVPVWLEKKLNKIVEAFEANPITEDTMVNLRSELSAIGLGDLFLKTLNDKVERNDQA